MKTIIFGILSVAAVGLADVMVRFDVDLDDSYLKGTFSGFTSASFSVSANDFFDFWVVDEEGYNEWDDNKTPATAKMFQSTYCNDCLGHNVDFTLPSTSTKYYFIVSALFPETTPVGSITIAYTGTGEYSEAVEEEDSYSCFTGGALLLLRNGSSVQMKDARVGDEVLAATYAGDVSFSPIVHVPHKRNRYHAHFVKLFVEGHPAVDITRDHLLPTCPRAEGAELSPCGHCEASHLAVRHLKMGKHLSRGICVAIASVGDPESMHWRVLTAVESYSSREGTYSVVTAAPYPVVNGFVSSPFGVSHLLPRAFYSLHRAAHLLGIRNHQLVVFALDTVTTFFEYLVSLPQVKYMKNQAVYFADDFHSIL